MTGVPRNQLGLTIVELMISIALGLLVTMAATALLLSSKSGYGVQDENLRLQETGRYALETIARALRQAAYQEFDRERGAFFIREASAPNIQGFDASIVAADSFGIDSPSASTVNGSDILAVQFFGSGAGPSGDETMLNCAGFSVPAPPPGVTQEQAASHRGWSIFYVAKGTGGESELRCKYRGKGSESAVWNAEPIARGVESFQVLYGLDTDGDGLPNQFATATAINKLDGSLALDGADAAAKERDRNKKTYWKKVVVVKVALLLRGGEGVSSDGTASRFDLFGPAYGEAQASSDAGTRIEVASLSAAVRHRIRKVFELTIQIRNQAAGGEP